VEVGIYKTSYLLPNGQTQSFFGRFHVVLRKETGIWKILVDMDSTEGGTVGEKDFLAANPME
jgi:ketosteroid isomerase-like protein